VFVHRSLVTGGSLTVVLHDAIVSDAS